MRRPPGGIIFHPDGCFLIRTQTCGLTSIVQTRFTEVIASCERGLTNQPAPNGDFHSLRRKMLLWVALLNGLFTGLCLSGRADRPGRPPAWGLASACAAGWCLPPLPIAAFNMRSGTPSRCEAKPLETAGRLSRGHVGKGGEVGVLGRVRNRVQSAESMVDVTGPAGALVPTCFPTCARSAR